MGPAHHVLDLGCGNGRIAEYLSGHTGAHVTGLDYIPEAIRQAQERTGARAGRLAFIQGDINALDLPAGAFDITLSVDTAYFSDDLVRMVGQLLAALRPGGQMAFLYTHSWEPSTPPEEFDAATLAPDRTPLAQALRANGHGFRTWDWTAADERLTRLRGEVLRELEPEFRAEGLDFVYDNRMGEVEGMLQAHERGLFRRYLYHVQTAPDSPAT